MTEQERFDQLQQKLTALMQDESFVKRLMELETPEEIQSAFAAEGAEMTVEEIKILGEMLSRSIEKNGELSEEDLEEVAGGIGPIAAGLICLAVAIAGASGGTAGVAYAIAPREATRIFRSIGNWFRRW